MIEQLIKILEDKKADDIQVIDFKGEHSMVDAFIVTSADSQRQIWAIVNAIQDGIADIAPFVRVSGDSSSTWVSVDCGDVVVHVFDPAERKLYQLEKLWAAYLKKIAS
ncbi:MAG: ribosome silencing factor [Erysipelothrix sp.]|jgi:ribosome-associated protein|nr:ribosome silencing factor [Erysipelothrix sp.]